jgi:hypothetical protein
MDIIDVGTYADFQTVFDQLFNSGPRIFYADLTGSSGPFYLYGVGNYPNFLLIVRVKLDAKPSTFSTDWPSPTFTVKQLFAPLKLTS